jgi:hypothetical protein
MQNFITLGQPLLGERYEAEKKEEEQKKINNKYSGHFVPQQYSKAAHALRSDQFSFKLEFNSLPNLVESVKK